MPTVREWEDHFRAQANYTSPPPKYWIVNQKGEGTRVEPKLEMVSPIAQDVKRAESELIEMKKEGEPIPKEPIVTRLKPQKMKKKIAKKNKKRTVKQKLVKKVTKRLLKGWEKL